MWKFFCVTDVDYGHSSKPDDGFESRYLFIISSVTRAKTFVFFLNVKLKNELGPQLRVRIVVQSSPPIAIEVTLKCCCWAAKACKERHRLPASFKARSCFFQSHFHFAVHMSLGVMCMKTNSVRMEMAQYMACIVIHALSSCMHVCIHVYKHLCMHTYAYFCVHTHKSIDGG